MKWLKKLFLNFLIKYVLSYVKEGKMLTKIREFLAGKKTYLTALTAIIGVLVAYANGSMEIAEAARTIIEAILAITIRAGIAKK